MKRLVFQRFLSYIIFYFQKKNKEKKYQIDLQKITHVAMYKSYFDDKSLKK